MGRVCVVEQRDVEILLGGWGKSWGANREMAPVLVRAMEVAREHGMDAREFEEVMLVAIRIYAEEGGEGDG